MQTEKLLSAEAELKSTIDTAHEIPQAQKSIEQLSHGYLAVIYAYQGRRGDAQAMAQNVCGVKIEAALTDALKKARLCK